MLEQLINITRSLCFNIVVEEQLCDCLVRILDRFKRKTKDSEEAIIARQLSQQLLERLPCSSKVYELIVERKAWGTDDIQTIWKIFKRLVSEL
jgi:hypothetical protein